MRILGRHRTAGLALIAVVVLFAIALRIHWAEVVWREASGRFDAELREQSRTYPGHHAAGRHAAGVDIAAMLALLPPATALPGGGVRIAVIPTCAAARYALALSAGGGGIFVTVASQPDAPARVIMSRRDVTVPPSVARAMIARFDAAALPWPGDSGLALDGTYLGFERTVAGRTFSGDDNTSTYRRLASATHAALLPYVPELATTDDRWRRRSEGC